MFKKLSILHARIMFDLPSSQQGMVCYFHCIVYGATDIKQTLVEEVQAVQELDWISRP